MTIGKKFFSTVSLILIACIALFNASLFATLFSMKNNIKNTNSTSQSLIVDNVGANELEIAKESLYEYTYLFTQNTNDRFKYIENNLDSLSMIVQAAYKNGADAVNITDYTLLPGVSFKEAEQELKVIYDFHKFLKYDNSIYLYGSNAYYCSETGIVINSPVGSENHVVSSDIRQRDWYKLAKEAKGEIVWCKPYKDLASLGIITSCSKAVYDEDRNLLGVVSIDFEGHSLIGGNSAFNNKESIDNRYFSKYFIMNGNGEVILTSPNLKLSEHISDEGLRSILNDYNNTQDNINITVFENNIVSTSKLNINDWNICFIVDSGDISSNSQQVKTLLTDMYTEANNRLDGKIKSTIFWSIGITFVIMLGAFLLSMRLTRFITQPLDELSRGIKIVGRGNLKYRINLNTHNELADLAGVVNTMSEELEKNIQKIAQDSAEKERMITEIELGQTVQMSMLPANINSEGIDIYSIMKPARFVGGDFYDYFYTDNGKIAFVIADVSGKGIAAALFMSGAKAIINMVAKGCDNPQEIMLTVNKYLSQNNEDCMFVTAVIGILDTKTLKISYSVAGHQAPLLKSGKEVKRLPIVKSMPLGVNIEEKYKMLTYQLKKDDIMVLYTDGVVESINQEGEFFGEDSIIECLKNVKGGSSKEITDLIINSSLDFSNGCEQFDDMTLTVINLKEGPSENAN